MDVLLGFGGVFAAVWDFLVLIARLVELRIVLGAAFDGAALMNIVKRPRNSAQ